MNRFNLIHISENHFCSKSRKRKMGVSGPHPAAQLYDFTSFIQAVNLLSVFAELGLNLRPVHVFLVQHCGRLFSRYFDAPPPPHCPSIAFL
jgi:hypothetical protein